MVKFGLILLLLAIPIDLIAQSFIPDPDWRFESFTSQNHFISRDIPNLTIDKHGYLWTCSQGIQRFDGFKTLNFNSRDKPVGALRTNYTNLTSDEQGRVWISSAGLCYYDDESGKFVYIQSDAPHAITFINALCVQKNCIWFTCDYGLAKLDLHTLKVFFTSLNNVNDALCSHLINENTLLVSSREKLFLYNIKKDTYSDTTLTYNHSLLKIFAVTKKGGDVFLGTNQGLFTFKNLHEVELADRTTEDVDINDVFFLHEDKEKKYLFLATEGKGLMVYNTILKKVEFSYVHSDDNPYSLPNNIVSNVFDDKKGKLWIATSSGVSMLDVFNQQWKMRFISKSNSDGLSILKIARDKFDSSKVWMSSFHQGIISINWKTKKIENIFNATPELKKVYDFVQLSKRKWLLATQKKIIEWDPKLGILSETRLPVPDSLRLVFNIRKLIVTPGNACFIATNRGLFKYDLNTRKINIVSQCANKKPDELLKYDLQCGFYENGILWIVSRNGLFSYDIAKQQTRIYRGKGDKADYFLFDVTNATNGQIICAAGNGITIFNKKTKEFKVIHSIANLYQPHCEKVISIKNTVWIGTDAGILNYNLDTHSSARTAYESSQVEIFPRSPFALIGNDMVLGLSNGYAYFTPDLQSRLLPSAPVIETVAVNNQSVFGNHIPQGKSGQLVFDHLNNSINIAFTAFLYTDPDHINFRYQLKGADSQWQYTDGRRNANYEQLPAGSYTFNVQSGNKNGVWNSRLASFNFMIQPPYWETWWFRTLVVSIIAFGLYSLYRYKINHILAIERIRERIASDFHDDIGSALSSISIFSEVVDKQLKQKLPPEQIREIVGHISFHSRAMLDAMDDIIWAVNPQNDQFNDLAVRMREFAIPLFEARNILFDFDIQEDILNTRIKMDARKNIFLIFKECINNILKHSDCSAMTVAIDKLNNQLRIIISDNGKGFDVNAPNSRNGLKNMNKRAAEIHGSIEITTQPGRGAITKLLVNII